MDDVVRTSGEPCPWVTSYIAVGGDSVLNHSSTLTGLHKALQGSRKSGALDFSAMKLAVDLQTLSEEIADRMDVALFQCVF